MSKDIKKIISSLPDQPGVYIYKDAEGRIIYIGKAKSLKKRVASYFTKYLSSKTQALVSKICDIEYITTATEYQAQLLEAELIRDNQPQYNVSFKDDKSFPMIAITKERFPRITLSRALEAEKNPQAAFYYGPYPNAKLVRQSIKFIRRLFGFRSCKTMPNQPCLYFRLGLCPAPCIGKITAEDYAQRIEQIRLFLECRYDQLIEKLTQKMKKLAEQHLFEEAAQLRDQIKALSMVTQTGEVSTLGALEQLKKCLRLNRLPLHIEGFDVSNIAGKEATAAMVCFSYGRPDKKNYRRFRIKTVYSVDDYAMIREVIRRRYRRLKEEKTPLPDLVVIDGGKQHLLAASEQIKKLGLSLQVISITKDPEQVYSLKGNRVINFEKDSLALNLLRYIRNEAHRFARKYHLLLRKKKLLPQV
ncbi:MAG: excinuclease ABC subunit UvrC [Candidatus Omnitrophica bacterium]|nr:excinuclease ABC subunit UvrC [Candidatus Omnitrophota bacterium]